MLVYHYPDIMRSIRKIFLTLVLSAVVLSAFLNPVQTRAEGLTTTGPFTPLKGSITSALEIVLVQNVSSSWQTVSLENNYTNAIPICTYVLPSSANNPAAIRIQNITASSFEVRIQQPPNNPAVTTSDVFCIVTEEGLHTLSDGRTFEAHTVVSTNVSGNSSGGWGNGEDVSGDIVGTYSNPVVLGQVISYNNTGFSTFWSYDCDSAGNVPFQSGMADGICVDRHMGQISGGGSVLTRNTENLGYIVVEGDPTASGSADPVGNLSGGQTYEVALGADTVDGVDNSGISYSLNNSGYTIGLVTEAAIDGNNGGWAVLYGSDPLAGSQIDVAIDEDTLGDTERAHTTENVSYWVFNTDPGLAFMESFVIASVDSTWQTVNLSNDYTSLVPVCSYHLPSSADNEVAIRIQNINNGGGPDSFQIRLQQPRNGSSVTASDVHCVVVEEGSHVIPDNIPARDRNIEAHIVASDEFNENNDWNTARMENVGYSNVYNRPIVFGQVTSYNDSDFSLFWSNNGTATSPPDTTNLYVGKHVGEDPGTTALNDEILGYLVVEGGSGFSDGFFYEAALGPDTIVGVGNSPPYIYNYSVARDYSYGVLTQEAMDGSDGSWAVLYGANPLSGTGIDLAVDEEIAAGDTSRTHTNEQVAFWVFDPVIGGTVWNDIDIDGDLEAGEPVVFNNPVWLCPDTHTGLPSSPNCQSTTTDTNGAYYFRDISPGNYYIAAEDPAVSQSSTWGGDHDPLLNDQIDDGIPDGSGYAVTQTFTYTASTGSTFIDFGFADTVEIGGTVWNDDDANGNLDIGESAFGAVTVWLCPSTHVMPPTSPSCMSTTTDSVGEFYYPNINSGSYYFAVDDPSPFYISTLGGNHDPSANDQIDDGEPYSGGGYVQSQFFTHVSTVASTSFDFGYSEYSEIGGIVWDDNDGDGIQNGGIIGIQNVDVELFDGSGTSQGTTSTALNGTYLFSGLLAGNYYLTFTLPTGLLFSPDNIGSDDTIDSDPDRTTGITGVFSIAPGITDLTWDTGLYPQGAHIFDPPSGWKTVDSSGWPTLVWRQVWINDSNTGANAVRIVDPIPTDTTYISASLICTPTGGSSTTNCAYDGVTSEIIWEGTIAPDPGATDEGTAANEVVILFETTVGLGINQVENQSSAYWDENGDGTLSALDNNIQVDIPEISDDPDTAASSDPTIAIAPFTPITPNIPARLLPSTGFQPGETTTLPPQSYTNAYTQSSLTLIIPSIDIEIPIIGVPYLDGNWNTTWLGSTAGYLEGSAYPTLPGNTVVTAHVWDAYNQPGPFYGLTSLVYGDRIIIDDGLSQYHYLVQDSTLLDPSQTQAVFQHEDLDWISLVTCENWDEGLKQYHNRRLVRAVLVLKTDK